MGKTRDLFKKIRAIKGRFNANMGTIKDRKGMELTEEEDIKKRWQEYIALYKKYLNDPDNQDGVITYLKPHILEYTRLLDSEGEGEGGMIWENGNYNMYTVM